MEPCQPEGLRTTIWVFDEVRDQSAAKVPSLDPDDEVTVAYDVTVQEYDEGAIPVRGVLELKIEDKNG